MAAAGGPDSQAAAVPCAGQTTLFFATDPASVVEAARICARCPLADRCLTVALERGEPHGVWGGVHFPDGARRIRRHGDIALERSLLLAGANLPGRRPVRAPLEVECPAVNLMEAS
jgi:WhiB family redox-sensing transcriptional regulator